MAIPPPPSDIPAVSLPPRTALLTNITEQTSLLQRLFTVLANPTSNAQSNPPGVAIPTLYAGLQARTRELESITEGLWEHQKAWAEMKKKESEVRALETQVKSLIMELEGGRRELEGLIQDAENTEVDSDLDSERQDQVPNSSKISVPVLLSHARSLARHSSAPTSSLLSLGDKSQFQPWPTETAMRKGILFMEGGSMGTIGEIERHQPGQVIIGGHEDVQMEEVVEEQRPRGPAPIFDLDLNSDSDED